MRTRNTALLAAALAAVAGPPAARGGFTNVTAEAGITHVQARVTPGEMASMTGGAAARDFDGDGRVDLVFTRWDDGPVLYRNLGNGRFEDVTAASGIGSVARTNGAGWADVDNDGDADLYITRADARAVAGFRHHLLYVNDGSGRFTEQAVSRGAAAGDPNQPRYGTSVAFGDFDRDGFLDVHTNEWGLRDQAPSTARLLRNRGGGTPGYFVDVTERAGVALDLSPGYGPLRPNLTGTWAFSSRFTDLDRDGYPDLVVASDFNTSRLFWNNGDSTFTDVTEDAGVGTDENGMGLAVGDANGDGWQDLFITSIYHTDPPGQGQ